MFEVVNISDCFVYEITALRVDLIWSNLWFGH